MEEFVEYINIIKKINSEIFDLFIEKHGYSTNPIGDSDNFEQNSDCFVEEYPLLSLVTNGDAAIIELYGIQIWNSEDDDRPQHRDENDPSNFIFIDLELYLKVQVRAYLNRIHQIHMCLEENEYFKD